MKERTLGGRYCILLTVTDYFTRLSQALPIIDKSVSSVGRQGVSSSTPLPSECSAATLPRVIIIFYSLQCILYSICYIL